MTAHLLAKKTTPAISQVYVLSFSTSDILQQSLKPAFTQAGYDVEVSSGGFGVVVPELLKPQFAKSDALIIQMDSQGFFSRDWRSAPEDCGAHWIQEKPGKSAVTKLIAEQARTTTRKFLPVRTMWTRFSR